MFRYAPLKKIQSWSNWMTDDLIIKSATRMFMDEDGNLHYVRGELPEEGYNLEDGTDYPPTAFHPITRRLLEGHNHPIDYLAQEMAKLSEINRAPIGSADIEKHINEMIRRNNSALLNRYQISREDPEMMDKLNKISNVLNRFSHPEWRKNTSTSFGDDKIKDIKPETHQHRSTHGEDGNHGKFINYLHKKGDGRGEHVDKGNYIDAALGLPFREHMGPVLDMINQEELAAGRPAPYLNWQENDYTDLFNLANDSTIPLGKLSNGSMFSIKNQHHDEMVRNRGRLSDFDVGQIGGQQTNVPERQVEGNFHNLITSGALPAWAYEPVDKGGRPKGGESIAQRNQRIRQHFEEHGHPYAKATDKFYDSLMKIPAFAALFDKRSVLLRGNNAIKIAINAGLPEDRAVDLIQDRMADTKGTSAISHGDRAKGHSVVVASLLSVRDALAHHLMEEQGLSMEDARALASQRMYESKSPHAPASKNLINEFEDHGGARGISEEMQRHLKETAISPLETVHRDQFQIIPNKLPQLPGYHTGEDGRQTTGQTLMLSPATSSVSPTSTPMGSLPYAAPQTPAPTRIPGQPTNLPPELRADIDNLLAGKMQEVTKSLEKMQLKRARNNTELLKSLPNYTMDISSMNDVRSFSQQFGMLPQDIHAITSSRGDWAKIAKQWHLPLRNIELVKLAFGGI